MVTAMRVMPDTNVLTSAALFPDSKFSLALADAMQEHTLVICSYILEELQEVFDRKFPDKVQQLDTFLSSLAYELCSTPDIRSDTPAMRDEDDRPILQAAIDSDVDVVLTGDKDFHAIGLDYPKIISPADFFTHP